MNLWPQGHEPSPQALGERMYREGLLPSGEPMKGLVRGDVPVEGAAFACASCHMQAGLGSAEGGVATPATNGEKLFRPWFRYHPFLEGEERRVLPESIRDALRRPAYTEADLERALTEGVAPDGRDLSDIMPRYALSSEEARLLVRYLKGLSATASPGVTQTTLKFATIIAGEVSAEDRADFLEVLRYRIEAHNRRGAHRDTASFRALAALEGALAFRDWSLSVWELKGPPGSWADQLEAHLRREPVFAVLSGLSYGPWEPIHAFSERHRLPCILPLTEHPQPQGPGWYTLYFSKGPRQEGEAAAAYLSNLIQKGAEERPILQVVASTPEAQAVAKGFDAAWADRGHDAVHTVRLRPGQRPDAASLLRRIREKGAPILLLWAGPESYAGLRSVKDPSALVLLSTSLLGPRLWELPQEIRDQARLAYPYRLFRPPASMMGQIAASPAAGSSLSLVAGDTHRRIRSRAFTVMKTMEEVISHMERNFYRDHLLDTFSMLMDDLETDYERLSYGPGQRFASKGCYVVRMPKGDLHGFIKDSDWVIH
ncbi:MAG: ABC transporter substrate-binding protein [Firmicutes bacterium]|nr:ABC transporter substrate-binding protein [Bacillota bacterium]